jgi:protein transport protein SEC20
LLVKKISTTSILRHKERCSKETFNNAMSATSHLLDQLAHISDTLKSTNTLITRLSKLTFQPGTEPLDGESSVRIELAQDIHESLKQLEEDLELLTQEAEDLNTTAGSHRRRESDRDRERARLSAQVARLSEDLKHSRSQFRRAQLTAKKASQTAKQKERELIFASLQTAPSDQPNDSGSNTPDLFAGRRKLGQQKQLTKEELEVDASSNVTAALRRTHDLLSTELSRSRFAQETFDQSTAALADLGEKYSDLDTILKNSRELLGTLLRSQKSDSWYLETAFYILAFTLGWLFFRRILWGPFFLLPRFLFRWFIWPPLAVIFNILGLSGGGTAVSSQALTKTRPPLIVQPSAGKDSQPRFPEGMSQGPNVPAGGGGANAKIGKQPLSDEIGRMAEESEKQAQGHEKEEVRRADGTVLPERGDLPLNPKKKMFEAEVEDKKYEEQQRQQKQEGGDSGQRRKRDEL